MNHRSTQRSRNRQRGAALVIAVILFALIGVSAVIAIARGTDLEIEKNRRTSDALAQAKAALIGYAADVVLTNGNRFGDLPCPDTDGDGTAIIEATGLPEVCDTPDKRIGRLPWKTLGLPDLRDGDGERLWYAVSVNFKNSPRTSCVSPTDTGCLNSDSRGTITVRNASGAIAHNAALLGGVVAVIIAPGAAITRMGAGAVQDRSAGGLNTAVNYLDVAYGEDNATMADGSTDGFIGGPIAIGGNVVVNDRIVAITYQDLMPVLEKRVVHEVSRCLDQYASANGGRYPWAADSSVSAMRSEPAAAPYSYPDATGVRAGRIPEGIVGSPVADEQFTSTRTDSGNTMAANWPGEPCTLGVGYPWWMNWKLYVFYAVADAYKPASTGSAPACGSCLTVASAGLPPETVRYVVAVGGRSLPVAGGQARALAAERANPQNYLEGENVFTATPLDSFERQALSATFNDVLAYR